MAIPTFSDDSSNERQKNVYMAWIAEQAERFPEMALFISNAVRLAHSDPLTTDERNLLSSAYKNLIASCRSAWRVITHVESKEEAAANEDHLSVIRRYRAKIESELTAACNGILELLDEHLIPFADSPESKVFYLKLKGDYLRYLAEFRTGQDKKDTAEDTLAAYRSAQDIAVAELVSTHPIRLGLALNFSVFYYEILVSPERACNLAKQAFDEAIAELDTLGEEAYKDSTMIMQLLRDNLTLWTSDVQEDTGDQNVDPKPGST